MIADAITQRTLSSPEWFAAWFDSVHYHTLYAGRDEAEAAALVDRLMATLDLKTGAAILDLGCGTGRHARALAARGFDVTGLDLSAESIRQARHSQRSNLRYVRQDMRQPFGVNAFDCVLNFFTSFGYFDEAADHLAVARNISASLRPGGRLVLDYLNVRHAEAHITREEETRRDGVTYRLSRWTDDDHIYKRIVIGEGRDPAPLEYTERIAKLTLEDFRFVLGLHDLDIESVHGDYNLAPFDVETSPRLIVLASSRQVPADAADRLRGHAQV